MSGGNRNKRVLSIVVVGLRPQIAPKKHESC
jgi:hypothetical protein